MSIRIRCLPKGTVALCAVETDPMPDDIYLDDAAHYALAAKFAQNFRDCETMPEYVELWALMETQKVRDAQEELSKYLAADAIGGKDACKECEGTGRVYSRDEDTGAPSPRRNRLCPQCKGGKDGTV